MSQIFSPYQELGCVSSSVRIVFCSHSDPQSRVIYSVSGSQCLSFKYPWLDQLSTLNVTGTIRAMCVQRVYVSSSFYSDLLFLVTENSLHVVKNNQVVTTVPCIASCILRLGNQLLTTNAKTVTLWDIPKLIAGHKEVTSHGIDMNVTCVCHPVAYVDKVIFGCENGRVVVYNIRVGKSVFEKDFGKGAVTDLCVSPVLDVIAVGTAFGAVYIYNIKTDKVIRMFEVDSVANLAFGEGVIIVCGGGKVVVWELENGTMVDERAVELAQSVDVVGDDIIIAGLNSIEIASLKGLVRKFARKGPVLAPYKCRFYGLNWLLCSNSNALYLSNIDGSQTENIRPTARGRVVDFAMNNERHFDWDNVVTVHQKDSLVGCWSVRKRAASKEGLYIPHSYGEASCVSISPCGNMIFIGRVSGRLEKWYLQSKRFIGVFQSKPNSAITAIDSNVENLISGDFQGKIRIWNVSAMKMDYQIDLKKPVGIIIAQKGNVKRPLVAIGVDTSFDILLLDINAKKIVRILKGHTSKINDLCFYKSMIISCGMDGYIIVWDLVASKKIDWIHFVDSPCLSLDLHPSGLHFATSHIGHKKIFMWVNRMLFSKEDIRARTKPTQVKISGGEFFNISSSNIVELIDEDEEMIDKEEKSESSLITLSGEPKSFKLNALTYLDIIRRRNKIKSKKRKSELPFFLHTLPSLEKRKFSFDDSKMDERDDGDNEEDFFEEDRVILSSEQLPSSSIFFSLVKKEDFPEALNNLKSMEIKNIDLTIRNMSTFDDSEIIAFLNFVSYFLQSGREFDLIQTVLNLFLRVHSEVIVASEENDTLFKKIEEVKELQKSQWEKLDSLRKNALFLVKTFAFIE